MNTSSYILSLILFCSTGELKPCSGYLGKTLSLFPNFHDPDPHCKITSEDVDVFKDAFAGKKEKDQKIFYLEYVPLSF